MTDTKCEFCGSKNVILKTPYIELKENGNYEPKTSYCCSAQKKNQEYEDKHYHPLFSEKK